MSTSNTPVRGKQQAFPGGVELPCGEFADDYVDLVSPFNQFCLPRIFCKQNFEWICLDYKNWYICDYDGCTARVSQILPRNPMINGETLGLFPFEGWGGSNLQCLGRNYTSDINSFVTRDEIQICPGDTTILTLPDFELPEGSGLCLTVNILDLNGNEVESAIFEPTDPEVDGDEVDLTELFSLLETEVYRMEMILGCCEGESGCSDIMSVKRAYIEIEGEFTYDINIGYSCFFTGQNSVFPPSTDPFGPILQEPSCSWPIPFYQLLNVDNINQVDVTTQLWRISCEDPSVDISLVDTRTIASNDISQGATAFLGLQILDTWGEPGCFCYRIEVIYDDGCGEEGELSRDNHYFRAGSGCEGLKGDEEPPIHRLEKNGASHSIHLAPNPVREELNLQWSGISPEEAATLSLTIFNSVGQVVKRVSIPNSGQSFQLPADMPAGAYHYMVTWPQGKESGTFIKASN